MKRLFMAVLISCMILIPNLAFSENHKLPISQILEIANIKAIEVGYDIKKAEIILFKDCFPDEVLFPRDSLSKRQIEIKNNLENKSYLAVYYRYKPKPNTFGYGGDLTIFVDAITGEILEVYRGA